MADKIDYCGHCGEEASQRCDDCTVMNYCSDECHEADRNWHKLLCKQFPDFIQPDTENDVRRAILLPENSNIPVFIWVKVDVEEEDEEEDADGDVEIAEDLGVPAFDSESGSVLPSEEGIRGFEDGGATFSLLVCGKWGGGTLLDHSLRLPVRDDFTQCRPNVCLERLVGLEVASQFRGPVVFVRMTKVEDSSYILDIDSADFTLALDGLVEYAKKQANPLTYFQGCGGPGEQPKKVAGVNINANIPHYEEVSVLRSNAVFSSGGEVSELLEKLGTPLLMIPLDTEACSEEASSCSEEAPSAPPAAYLNVCIHTSSPAFGSIPFSTTTSALFVRPDESSISTSEVIYLCNFIKDVAQPELLKASEASPEERKAAVDSVVEMWKARTAAANADESDGEVSLDDDDSDDGLFDDLADVRAKMGQMQMTTKDARTGMGYI